MALPSENKLQVQASARALPSRLPSPSPFPSPAPLRICAGALAFAFALVLALVVCCVFACVRPAPAYALFNKVADSFPAAQDLGSYGVPIYGDQLPDGSYQVGARTTSRMCILYTDAANAEARDSKEQAIVLAQGGGLTAVFYISKAYTHLYLGTQEEAAALTNEEGTDASAYIAGDPDEGYVPHLFAIPIPALNEPITLATFSGGDKGIEGGAWYTRQVVFSMSETELQGYVAAAAGEGDALDGGEADAGADADDESAGGGDSDDTSSTSVESADSSDAEDADSTGDSDTTEGGWEDASAQNVALSANNVVAGTSGAGAGTSGAGSGAVDAAESDTEDAGGPASELDEAGEDASSQGAPVRGAGTMRGVRMNIAGTKLVVDVSDEQLEAPDEAARPLLSTDQALALALVAAFTVGIAARVGAFAHAYERPAKPPAAAVSPAAPSATSEGLS